MKTKPFLLATAGSTVDGRNIDDAMLEQMASSYDPKTYGARLNIEHIRGISGDKPFRAYGDVLELSVGETEVNFNGKTEKRKALFGTFDVTDDAKQLNDAAQKVYPSIEIEPNFAGKGYAYLMGCALTDSPAAIGTERLAFNRALPGTISLTAETSGVAAAALEFPSPEPDANDAATEVKGFFAKLTEMLSGSAPKEEPKQPAAPANPPAFDAATFAADLGKTLETAFAKQADANKAALDALTARFTKLEQDVENAANPNHHNRPPANGPTGDNLRAEF
ncbi:MAG: GPO family capsid scaffolding protein [Novosphingobium sp.]|nr:GPO family capsid scaffolding protein [Novosphingobium sp.]